MRHDPVSSSFREQLKDLVRADLSGLELVDELLADRRAQAAAEDDT